MENLDTYQYALIGALFVWSGFVRSGLGFGGAVLSLPFLLLIIDNALVFLPLIAAHQIVFGVWAGLRAHHAARTGGSNAGNIAWDYLRRALKIMLLPTLVGVLGLLTLPPHIMSTIIFVIVIAYSIGYVLNRPVRSIGPKSDAALLALGAYINGTSLIGGPLIVSVFASHVARHQLRDTLLAAWLIVVSIKMASFIIVGVDLQLIHHLWLFPCVLVGHFAGDRMHHRLLRSDPTLFFRVLGAVLLGVSIFGILWTLR